MSSKYGSVCYWKKQNLAMRGKWNQDPLGAISGEYKALRMCNTLAVEYGLWAWHLKHKCLSQNLRDELQWELSLGQQKVWGIEWEEAASRSKWHMQSKDQRLQRLFREVHNLLSKQWKTGWHSLCLALSLLVYCPASVIYLLGNWVDLTRQSNAM